jgi:hypothetical protein
MSSMLTFLASAHPKGLLPHQRAAHLCVKGNQMPSSANATKRPVREEMTVDNHEQPATVAIEHLDGQWVVHFTVDGEATQRLFDLGVHAKNFAAGQRVRLGLPGVPDGP